MAAGNLHTVALSEAGHMFTWGHGEDGQLGHNDPGRQLTPRQMEAGRFGGEKVVFVAAGGFHTVAMTAEGWIYTWGLGEVVSWGMATSVTGSCRRCWGRGRSRGWRW